MVLVVTVKNQAHLTRVMRRLMNVAAVIDVTRQM